MDSWTLKIAYHPRAPSGLGSVWLGDKVEWDGPISGSWDGTSLFSVWLRKDGTNPFSVWFWDFKSGMSY